MDRPQLQLINDDKEFRDEYGLRDKDYHLVAILGPQSSGKSTLLNQLFGTCFDIMQDDNRSQTTHGIWLSHSSKGPVLVMDVEGTDGRERAEDQEFERKGALFSLATAEVLIINMWEHSVGLYQGANMGLLRTIMDVHLQIFKDEQSAAATSLLFVIRDYLGQTPIPNLKATVMADLKKIWASLKKPDSFESLELESVFTFDFAFLPHKVLKPNEFMATCDELARRFQDGPDSIFGAHCSPKIVPIDGLAFYLQSIWDKIRLNSDLNLPSQQELLAQFRCDELAQEAFAELVSSTELATARLRELREPMERFGETVSEIKQKHLDGFSSVAYRYSQNVFEKKLFELVGRIDSHLYPIALSQLQSRRGTIMKSLDRSAESWRAESPLSLAEKLTSLRISSIASLDDEVENVKIISATWDFAETLEELARTLGEGVNAVLLKRFLHEQALHYKDLGEQLAGLVESEKFALQDDLPAYLKTAMEPLREETGEVLTRLASDLCQSSTHQEIIDGLNAQVDESLKKIFTETKVRQIIRSKFDLEFKHDKSQRPRVWSAADDVNRIFDDAKNKSLAALEQLRTLHPLHTDIRILTDRQSSELSESLKKDFNMIYLDTKRSLVSQQTKIPMWIYVLLVVLGWNEFVSILSSPLYLTAFLLLVAGFIVTHALGIQAFLYTSVSSQIERCYDKCCETYHKASPFHAHPAPKGASGQAH